MVCAYLFNWHHSSVLRRKKAFQKPTDTNLWIMRKPELKYCGQKASHKRVMVKEEVRKKQCFLGAQATRAHLIL